MKEKTREALQKVSRKQAVLLVAVAILATGGTATVIDMFGQTEGTVNVEDQAIAYNGAETVSINGATAPTTSWTELSVSNNNPDQAVFFNWELDSSTSGAFSAGVYDIEQAVQFSNTVAGTTYTTEVSYDTSEDEVVFEVPEVTDYSNSAGIVMYLDLDADGVYDYHVDSYSSGQGADLYKWNVETSSFDNVRDWTQTAGAYEGISTSSSSSTQDYIGDSEDFELRVDSSKVSADFKVAVREATGAVNGESSGDSSSYNSISFPQVDGSEVGLNGGSEKKFALIAEANSAAEAESYTATAKATPVVN